LTSDFLKKALHFTRYRRGRNMATDGDTDEVFDEEELAEGFDEEIAADEIGDDVDDAEADDLVGEDIEGAEDEEAVVEAVVVEDEEDVADDADVELALDEVLAETIMRTTVIDDDEDAVVDTDTVLDPAEAILPKQDDEFRCSSCRLLKKTSQLADKAKMLCRDCV
jgi:hypothetical protein